MSTDHPLCPKCQSPHAYEDGSLLICPECFHEWNPQANTSEEAESSTDTPRFLDANGTPLSDGDTVVTIKDLKAGKDTIKAGTKVKNIKLLDEPINGHDISCKVPEHGSMYLKCSVVKKSN